MAIDPRITVDSRSGIDAMRIRVLCSEGCPNSQATMDRVHSIAALQAPAAVIDVIEVRSQSERARLRFLGSPTVQVNGIDIDPAARERIDFGMAGRMYVGSGIPPQT